MRVRGKNPIGWIPAVSPSHTFSQLEIDLKRKDVKRHDWVDHRNVPIDRHLGTHIHHALAVS